MLLCVCQACKACPEIDSKLAVEKYEFSIVPRLALWLAPCFTLPQRAPYMDIFEMLHTGRNIEDYTEGLTIQWQESAGS